MKNEILYYVVYRENTLGYLFSLNGRNYLGILHASILKGSTFNWLNGPVLADMSNVRRATAKDFEEYRVCLPPDFTEKPTPMIEKTIFPPQICANPTDRFLAIVRKDGWLIDQKRTDTEQQAQEWLDQHQETDIQPSVSKTYIQLIKRYSNK